ncbi:curlin repeat-containing protein, partial [Psychrobacter sp. SIMBA_152]
PIQGEANFIVVQQQGSSNVVEAANGMIGNDNLIDAYQRGDNNYAVFATEGDMHNVELEQTGDNNTAVGESYGEQNDIMVSSRGDDN